MSPNLAERERDEDDLLLLRALDCARGHPERAAAILQNARHTRFTDRSIPELAAEIKELAAQINAETDASESEEAA